MFSSTKNTISFSCTDDKFPSISIFNNLVILRFLIVWRRFGFQDTDCHPLRLLPSRSHSYTVLEYECHSFYAKVRITSFDFFYYFLNSLFHLHNSRNLKCFQFSLFLPPFGPSPKINFYRINFFFVWSRSLNHIATYFPTYNDKLFTFFVNNISAPQICRLTCLLLFFSRYL